MECHLFVKKFWLISVSLLRLLCICGALPHPYSYIHMQALKSDYYSSALILPSAFPLAFWLAVGVFLVAPAFFQPHGYSGVQENLLAANQNAVVNRKCPAGLEEPPFAPSFSRSHRSFSPPARNLPVGGFQKKTTRSEPLSVGKSLYRELAFTFGTAVNKAERQMYCF